MKPPVLSVTESRFFLKNASTFSNLDRLVERNIIGKTLQNWMKTMCQFCCKSSKWPARGVRILMDFVVCLYSLRAGFRPNMKNMCARACENISSSLLCWQIVVKIGRRRTCTFGECCETVNCFLANQFGTCLIWNTFYYHLVLCLVLIIIFPFDFQVCGTQKGNQRWLWNMSPSIETHHVTKPSKKVIGDVPSSRSITGHPHVGMGQN